MADASINEYRDVSDEQLAQFAQKGDDDAFSALVARYIFVVRSRAAGYQGSGIEPEDLSQEGMIGLMSAVVGYDPACGAAFKTFARLCIDRSILSAVKAVFRKRQIPKNAMVSIDERQDDLPLSERLSGSRVQDPETVVIAREDMEAFNQRIAAILTSFERSVLQYYLGGCNYATIAKRLDCPVKSVDNALQRLRRKLK